MINLEIEYSRFMSVVQYKYDPLRTEKIYSNHQPILESNIFPAKKFTTEIFVKWRSRLSSSSSAPLWPWASQPPKIWGKVSHLNLPEYQGSICGQGWSVGTERLCPQGYLMSPSVCISYINPYNANALHDFLYHR